jgi:hypothetical protein
VHRDFLGVWVSAVRFLIDAADSGGGFSLVEHPMSAHALGAPLHRHTREGEYSFVLMGRIGALLGDQVIEGGPVISFSSRATSGTRSGMLATSQRGSWKSFLQPDSSVTLPNSLRWAGHAAHHQKRCELSASGTVLR